MPHTQTHRTVSLLISTRTGAHTCTHTHKLPWSLYTVTSHLLHKHSPLSFLHTHVPISDSHSGLSYTPHSWK